MLDNSDKQISYSKLGSFRSKYEILKSKSSGLILVEEKNSSSKGIRSSEGQIRCSEGQIRHLKSHSGSLGNLLRKS